MSTTTPPPQRRGKSSSRSKPASQVGRSAAKSRPTPDDWEAWQALLTSRRAGPSLFERLGADKRSPLGWGWSREFEATQAAQLVASLYPWSVRRPLKAGGASQRNGRAVTALKNQEASESTPPRSQRLVEQLAAWLEAESAGAPAGQGLAAAFESLAIANALVGLSGVLEGEFWNRLFESLCRIAEQAAVLGWQEQPVLRQLIAAELPWTLATQLPEHPQSTTLARDGQANLAESLDTLLDGDGVLASRHIALWNPLLGSWTRCLAADGWLSTKRQLPKTVHQHFRSLVRQTLRWTRPGGVELALDDVPSRRSGKRLLRAATELAGTPRDHAVLQQLLEGEVGADREDRKGDRKRLPSPSNYSEWAEVAVLRGGWRPDAEQFAVAFGDASFRSELSCRQTIVWSGQGVIQVQFNGQPCPQTSDWQEVCWYQDADSDYLELEAEFGDSLRVQRQMLLGREDRFLLVCDAVLGETAGELQYRANWPLAAGVRFEGGGETHEGFLVGPRRLALVLPLGLPEWRCDVPRGQLQIAAEGLVLEQQSQGKSLFAPLFLDLDPKRNKQKLTWRQLTVAQKLKVVPADAAVGYRVQVGDDQFLVYRSLAPRANRTLLGQNVSVEFLAARFSTEGTIEELVQIE